MVENGQAALNGMESIDKGGHQNSSLSDRSVAYSLGV